jgi:isoleucyl-tRNA synthetase
VLKDRLYCDAASGPRRRSSQTVMHRMAADLARLMAPVLPFTADEVWERIPGVPAGSVHLALFPEAERPVSRSPSDREREGTPEFTSGVPDEALLARWAGLLDARGAVTKALEQARADRRIASSLEARVVLTADEPGLAPLRRYEAGSAVFPGNLANLFIVSGVVLREGGPGLGVEVDRAEGAKCERCWTWSAAVGRLPVHPRVCERCAAVLEAV